MGIVGIKFPISDECKGDLDDFIFSECEYSVSEK